VKSDQKVWQQKHFSRRLTKNESYVKEASSTICKETQEAQQEDPGIFSTQVTGFSKEYILDGLPNSLFF
jgi:hypothetical protein